MVRSPSLIAALFGALLLFSASPSAYAQTAQAEEEEEFDFLKAGEEAAKKKSANSNPSANDFNTYDSEDEDLANFKLAAPPPDDEKDPGSVDIKKGGGSIGTNRATKLPYDMVGKSALADNYEAQVIFVDRDAVVIELPVLIAREGSEYDGRGYWIVAEVYADGMKVTETRQQVSRPAVATQGPTMAFVKVLAPVPAGAGTLEIRVGKSSAVGGAPTPLFKRTVQYNTNG